MSVILTHGTIVLGVLVTGIAVIWVLQQRRSPQSALAWILFIFTLPYVGVPLFYALGIRKRGTGYSEIAFAAEPAPPPVHPVDDQLRRLGVPPASTGNRLVLETGPQAARASLEALVEGARDTLDVALYRLDPDPHGEAFVAALTRAAARGVRVRVLLDQVGTVWRPRRALRRFRAAGGEVQLFSPLLALRTSGRLNLRNHRKMVVSDGRTAWAGGRNVGAAYLGAPGEPDTWHDLSFTLEGPAVRRYVEVFEADWAKETGVSAAPRVAPAATDGPAVVQLIPSGPDLPHDGLHDALVHAIHAARARIWIVTPYLLPTDQLQHALVTAARLGRDVKIVVPAKSNQHIADFARGAYLRHLEEAGCTVLRFTAGMIHAKAAVIDDMALVGSANLDVRSMLLNFETALALYDRESVAAVAGWFAGVTERCAPGTLPAHLPRRLAEATFRLGAPIL